MKRLAQTLLVTLSALTFSAHAGGFSLRSPSIAPGGRLGEAQVLNGFGCQGSNTSPALQWKNPPVGTQSFAVTVYDPDAPTGSGWWHWVVYDIPATAIGLDEGAGSTDGRKLPQGSVQGRTDFGGPGYGGACPPAGDKPHRYIFTVHALKTPHLDLPADASAAMVGFMIHGNRLGSASVQAKYAR
ncbi:YbhB/YbcL family Raf kinase inhibitor-like protein [Propionivibrio soli]|uniref:YbhB/YbcL family Raf kinase inhibitor-like protein n=1 Tax=Propionivibrio soli TaxID=2976531 RepID=UPI0021E76350|nr:YbhB/YbcL family Raf kinase inhibitor-like protein [Propionivibrio soli]